MCDDCANRRQIGKRRFDETLGGSNPPTRQGRHFRVREGMPSYVTEGFGPRRGVIDKRCAGSAEGIRHGGGDSR